jgi:hypothetical protein
VVPIVVKVRDENYNNPAVPNLMRLEDEFGLQLRRKMGLVIHKQPHGWELNERAWTICCTMQKMSLGMKINKCKVGKKIHCFLKFGGDLIYAQPFNQYSEEGFLAKPKQAFRSRNKL